MQQEELEQQIQQSKLSLDQLKLEQNDIANRLLKNPKNLDIRK